MTIEQILTERRSNILPRWLEAVSAGIPKTPRCPRGASDRFGNPVKWMVQEALEEVYDRLCEPSAPTQSAALERLMRLRALDGPDVSRAVAFLGALKLLLKECALHESSTELAKVEARIDAFAKLACDSFTSSLELLSELRSRELARRTAVAERVLRRRAERENQQCQR